MIAIIATYEDDLLYLTSRLTFLSAERELEQLQTEIRQKAKELRNKQYE